jgi:hypothetical protein
MNLNCTSKKLSKKEEYLCKIKPICDTKYYNQEFPLSYKQSCGVYEPLQKSTFLALAGDKATCKIEYAENYGTDIPLDKVKLKCNQGKKISCCGEIEDPLYFCCKTIYSNTREYFENLTVPWHITSFDSKNRKVCIEIKSKFGSRYMNVTLPEQIAKS